MRTYTAPNVCPSHFFVLLSSLFSANRSSLRSSDPRGRRDAREGDETTWGRRLYLLLYLLYISQSAITRAPILLFPRIVDKEFAPESEERTLFFCNGGIGIGKIARMHGRPMWVFWVPTLPSWELFTTPTTPRCLALYILYSLQVSTRRKVFMTSWRDRSSISFISSIIRPSVFPSQHWTPNTVTKSPRTSTTCLQSRHRLTLEQVQVSCIKHMEIYLW